MIVYALVNANTWELEPGEFHTDIQIAGPRSEKKRLVLVAIEIPDDGRPSRSLWSGMRKTDQFGARWEWFGPTGKMLDAAPITWNSLVERVEVQEGGI
jgi:hypothetical protein